MDEATKYKYVYIAALLVTPVIFIVIYAFLEEYKIERLFGVFWVLVGLFYTLMGFVLRKKYKMNVIGNQPVDLSNMTHRRPMAGFIIMGVYGLFFLVYGMLMVFGFNALDWVRESLNEYTMQK
jgi:hypothetical protein